LKNVFLLVYHLNPQVLKKRERKSIEKKRGRKKENLQESLQIKKGSQYFERRKTFQLQNFLRESIFSPSIIPFQKPFAKSFEKILQLFLDHPSTW
jgi:hypothetical protein